MTKTLLISQEIVKEKLPMKKAIELAEKTFVEHGNDQVVMPAKITLDTGERSSWPAYGGSYNAMPAYIGSDVDISGIKWIWGFNDNVKKGIPYIGALIILNDSRTGEPLAIMDAAYITEIRTGASTGVAAKYLAKKNSKSAAIIGAGLQGRSNLVALKEALDIKEFKIVDIRKEAAKKLAEEVSKKYGIDARAVDTNQEAVEGSDVIVTVTTANEPLVMKEWLTDGALVVCVGSYQELEDSIPLTADKLVVDSWAQNSHRGELRRLVADGKISENNIYAEMGPIVVGKVPARENDKEMICACLIGMGSIDIAIGGYIFNSVKNEEGNSVFSFR